MHFFGMGTEKTMKVDKNIIKKNYPLPLIFPLPPPCLKHCRRHQALDVERGGTSPYSAACVVFAIRRSTLPRPTRAASHLSGLRPVMSHQINRVMRMLGKIAVVDFP